MLRGFHKFEGGGPRRGNSGLSLVFPAILILFSYPAFATVTQFDYNDSTSGAVQHTTIYSNFTGWGNISIRHTSPMLNVVKNGFWQIPTGNGTIPSNAVIDDVEMNYQVATLQPSNPCTVVELYTGNWVGANLDASAADFNGGNDSFIDLESYSANTWFSLGETCTPDTDCWPGLFVNKTPGGTMDFKAVCADTDTVDRGVKFEKTTSTRTKFRITWHLPTATLTPVSFVSPPPFYEMPGTVEETRERVINWPFIFGAGLLLCVALAGFSKYLVLDTPEGSE